MTTENKKLSLLFRVNGMPQGKGRSRSTKSGHHYTPKKTREYEREIREAATKAVLVQGWPKADKDVPLRVNIRAVFPVPASWSREKRALAHEGEIYPTVKPDGDNIGKAVCDAMNEVVYRDDAQVVSLTVDKRYCYSGETPHVTVFVEVMPSWSEMRAERLAAERARRAEYARELARVIG